MWRDFKTCSPVPAESIVKMDTVEIIEEPPAAIDGDGNASDGDQRSKTSRSASLTSASAMLQDMTLTVPQSNSGSTSPTPSQNSSVFNMAMFDPGAKTNRQPPPLPDPAGIEYVRAANWAANNCQNVLSDDKGRQLFRCFLFESLAEENLAFVEACEKLRKMKNGDEKKSFAKEILETYSPSINLSSVAMKRMKDSIESETPDPVEFQPAIKEVNRLLENDQFPRFRRSEIYLNFLEKLLPRAYAEKWANSFEGLLGNHVGRHHFRLFLQGIHAEENLRFWEAVVEYRAAKNKSSAMQNLGMTIVRQYLAEGTQNEVFLPFGVRQHIERRLAENEADITLFDEAIKHVEQVLRNDPYVRFLQSPHYTNLLAKLK